MRIKPLTNVINIEQTTGQKAINISSAAINLTPTCRIPPSRMQIMLLYCGGDM